jgi:hypothetical protein
VGFLKGVLVVSACNNQSEFQRMAMQSEKGSGRTMVGCRKNAMKTGKK